VRGVIGVMVGAMIAENCGIYLSQNYKNIRTDKNDFGALMWGDFYLPHRLTATSWCEFPVFPPRNLFSERPGLP
jgi:hypothetical protein